MNPEIVLNIVQQALQVTLLVAAPLLLTALGTGLLVSVFQAATQINEMTLSFIPKLVAIFAVLPQSLIVLVAGLGLLGPLVNALAIALRDEAERMAATTAFAVTASGLALAGIGSAFWGLVAGLAVLGLDSFKKR